MVAIGSPGGLESSVSMGVVSAIARPMRPDDRVIYLQTDGPSTPETAEERWWILTAASLASTP